MFLCSGGVVLDARHFLQNVSGACYVDFMSTFCPALVFLSLFGFVGASYCVSFEH